WFAGRASLAAAVFCLGIVTGRPAIAAPCHSTCTQELRACKRACASGDRSRRECRAACAERSNCTAPGARIRTLAYVVNECTTDPQGRDSLKQKLLIRRGNCDPVTVIELGPSTPVFVGSVCRAFGVARSGIALVNVGVFQGMAVLPDGSGVVFDVTKQFSQRREGDPAAHPGVRR